MISPFYLQPVRARRFLQTLPRGDKSGPDCPLDGKMPVFFFFALVQAWKMEKQTLAGLKSTSGYFTSLVPTRTRILNPCSCRLEPCRPHD